MLHRGRRSALFRSITAGIDCDVWAMLPSTNRPVRLRAIRNLAYLAHRQSPEAAVLRTMLRLVHEIRPRTFWDVGAHIGYYSWVVEAANPDTQIVMIEPDPVNVRLIRETLIRTPNDRVSLHPVAAGASQRRASFALDTITGATGTLVRPGANTFNERQYGLRPSTTDIDVVPLDKIDSPRPVDLLKIDVERHEIDVLAGAIGILDADRPTLILETGGDQCSSIMQRLEPYGYRFYDADHSDRREVDAAWNLLAVSPRHQAATGK